MGASQFGETGQAGETDGTGGHLQFEAVVGQRLVDLALDQLHVGLVVAVFTQVRGLLMHGLQCLLLTPDAVDQVPLESFLGIELLGEDEHVPHDVGEGVSFFDHCDHTRREEHLQLCLLGAEFSLASHVHVVMGKGQHTSSSCSSSPHQREGGYWEHRDPADEANKLEDVVALVFWCQTGGDFEVESSAEHLGEGGGDEGSGSFVGLDLIELSMYLPDEGLGEGIGLGVEEQVEDISLPLEDGVLFKFFRGDLQIGLELFDHGQ